MSDSLIEQSNPQIDLSNYEFTENAVTELEELLQRALGTNSQTASAIREGRNWTIENMVNLFQNLLKMETPAVIAMLENRVIRLKNKE